MLTTLALIVACLIVLAVLLVIFDWWMQQGIFGWFMAINMMDAIGHVCTILLTLIASLFTQDS